LRGRFLGVQAESILTRIAEQLASQQRATSASKRFRQDVVRKKDTDGKTVGGTKDGKTVGVVFTEASANFTR
jgi:hypothetical protein